MLIKLTVLLSGLLGFLAWVGWRFFISPRRVVAPSQIAGSNDMIKGEGDPRQVRWFHAVGLAARLSHRSLIGVILVTGFVAAAVQALSNRILLDPLQALSFQHGAHIQTVLNPEILVVPPALPPSMFSNTGRPALETANRDWERLDSSFLQQALLVFARMEARGYPLALLEGYRSPERQDELAALGAHVTHAKAFRSKHQYGLALDAAPVRDGKLVISEKDPWAMEAYRAFGEEAEKVGLIWGGRWSFKDYGHIEVATPIVARSRK